MKKYVSHIMKIFLSLVVLISCFSMSAQLHHQALTVQSNNYISSELVVFQSIGQLSPIGNYSRNNNKVFQGFQQPLMKKYYINKTSKPVVVAFPNPFLDHIDFLFKDYHPSQVNISIYDVNGKLIKEFNKGINQDLLSLNLEDIKDSNYLITFKAPGFFYSTKIIKK